MMTYQECINCGSKYGINEIVYFCQKCGDLLEIKYDYWRTEKSAERRQMAGSASFGVAIPRLHAHQRFFKNSLLKRRRNRASSVPAFRKTVGNKAALREK